MIFIPTSGQREFWEPASRCCFYCGEDISEGRPAVMWSGHETIVLHVKCARSFGAHLIADSREGELASGCHPWSKRAARALRTALIAEESEA